MSDVKWIKITTDIFNDEKIILIEQMPEADTMIVIWFKLLCMAGRDNNNGIFVMGNRIPYTEEMLASIFRRSLTTVRLALSTFEAFGMIDIIDDIITLPNWEKHQNIEGLEKIREQNRIRKQRQRDRDREKIEADMSRGLSRDVTQQIRIDKNKNRIDKNNNKDTEKTVYFPEDELLNEAFVGYVAMRKQIKKPMTDRAVTLAISKLKELAKIPFSDQMDNDLAIRILNQSVMNSWQGLFPIKENDQKNGIDWSQV